MHFICERVSRQPWCSFLCPCSRHKTTRNILISVFPMACDGNRFPKKTQAEQHVEAYALAPLRSCCTLLSHRCGWAFGSSVHVDWQVQWSIRFCTGGWWRWNKHPKFEWKMYFLTVDGKYLWSDSPKGQNKSWEIRRPRTPSSMLSGVRCGVRFFS